MHWLICRILDLQVNLEIALGSHHWQEVEFNIVGVRGASLVLVLGWGGKGG